MYERHIPFFEQLLHVSALTGITQVLAVGFHDILKDVKLSFDCIVNCQETATKLRPKVPRPSNQTQAHH
jgi:hypothetical protein